MRQQVQTNRDRLELAGDAPVKIWMLGRWHIEVDGTPLTPSPRMGQLMAYMAFHIGEGFTEKNLIDEIYPEIRKISTEKESLKDLVRRLPTEYPTLTKYCSGKLPRLLSDRVRTDVQRFLELEHQSNIDDAIVREELLIELVEIYGAGLLPDQKQQTWLIEERKEMQAKYAHALFHLLKPPRPNVPNFAMLYNTATGLLKECVASNLYDISAHERLVRHYLNGGQLDQASNALETMVRTLGNVADRQTRTLNALLSQKQQERTAYPPTQPLQVQPPLSPYFGDIYHGGQGNIEKLTQYLAPAASGQKTSEDLSVRGIQQVILLHGSPGVGKTRLAVEAAQCKQVREFYGDKICFVDLRVQTTPELMLDAIAQSLNLTRSAKDLLDQISHVLNLYTQTEISDQHHGRFLLILDNFEQLQAAKGDKAEEVLRELLVRVKGLTCLVTSRYEFERVPYRRVLVEPLPITTAKLLFRDRAQAKQPTFSWDDNNQRAVEDICKRVSCLPLGIELVAAWAADKSTAQMLEKLSELTQPLQAAFEYSYQQLTPRLQKFFTCLSIFQGSWSPEAAQTICREPHAEIYLKQLRERSLLSTYEVGDRIRYFFLNSLQHFADDKLSRETKNMLSLRHFEYYLKMANEAQEHLKHPDQKPWLDRLESELDNLRSALTWSCRNDASVEESVNGLRLAGSLYEFFEIHCRWREGQDLLKRSLIHADSITDTLAIAERVRVLQGLATLAYRLEEYHEALGYYEQLEAIGRRTGDKRLIAGALNGRGIVANSQGDHFTSWQLHKEALKLRCELNDQRLIAGTLNNLGNAAMRMGKWRAMYWLLKQSLRRMRDFGGPSDIATTLNGLGIAAQWIGDLARSRHYHEESLALRREVGDRAGIASSLQNLGEVARLQGEYVFAEQCCKESLEEATTIGASCMVAITTGNLGIIAQEQGDFETAERLHNEALSAYLATNDTRGIGTKLENLGNLERLRGNLPKARSLLEECLMRRREAGDRLLIAVTLAFLAAVLRDQGEYAPASKCLIEALTLHSRARNYSIAEHSFRIAASLLHLDNKNEEAANLLGTAAALRRRLTLQIPPSEQNEYDHVVPAIRSALGNETYLMAFNNGYVHTFKQAINYALAALLEE